MDSQVKDNFVGFAFDPVQEPTAKEGEEPIEISLHDSSPEDDDPQLDFYQEQSKKSKHVDDEIDAKFEEEYERI
jgi:hypothetical protein